MLKHCKTQTAENMPICQSIKCSTATDSEAVFAIDS